MSKPSASGHQLTAARVACVWSLSQLTMCTTTDHVHHSFLLHLGPQVTPETTELGASVSSQEASWELSASKDAVLFFIEEGGYCATHKTDLLFALLSFTSGDRSPLSSPFLCCASWCSWKNHGAHGRTTYQAEPEELLGRSLGCL